MPDSCHTEKKSKMVKTIPATGREEPPPLIFKFRDGKTKKIKAAAILRIADTPARRKVGLSKTASLAPLEGMYFNKAGSFWMPPEMKFPLDLVFVGEGGRVLEKKAMPLDNGVNTYAPGVDGAYAAIELPLGFCRKYGIRPGDIADPVGFR